MGTNSPDRGWRGFKGSAATRTLVGIAKTNFSVSDVWLKADCAQNGPRLVLKRLDQGSHG